MKKTLKNMRELANMTQAYVGQFLDVDKSTVSKWESGNAYPQAETLSLLAHLYGTSADNIIAAITAARTQRQGITAVGQQPHVNSWSKFSDEEHVPAEQTKMRGA